MRDDTLVREKKLLSLSFSLFEDEEFLCHKLLAAEKNKNLCSLLSRIRSSFDNNNKEKEREKRRRRKRVFHQRRLNKLSRDFYAHTKTRLRQNTFGTRFKVRLFLVQTRVLFERRVEKRRKSLY